MAEDFSNGWQLTESDPGVFSELLKNLGVPLVVDDLYSLDADSLAEHQPIRAFIFLFQWVQTHPDAVRGEYDRDFAGFFAHQVVNNACATLAVLNAIGNMPGLEMGPQLREMLDFAAGMDPQMTGTVLTSSDWLREAHNALSPPSSISLDDPSLKKTSEEAYHFVVYMPHMGSIYELDGLKEFPLRHGSYSESGEGWTAKAREIIQERIATYPPGQLQFNLLAVHDDPIPTLQTQLSEAQAAGSADLAAQLAARLERENHKRQQWAFENSLRRHNHIGFIHALLKALAKAGKLDEAKENAKKALAERRAKRGDSMDED
ncbi:cysteine proteinase [Phanerochaete sordida]|uniref:Ubiquitin carboxyl-terminal hydrolase n=1 Tax=Phanerochaete sordida TaxID=48140 RepID=A0A9P3LJ40_9APHY|nr:cysteine proteinase [Phanerochaete sordida]